MCQDDPPLEPVADPSSLQSRRTRRLNEWVEGMTVSIGWVIRGAVRSIDQAPSRRSTTMTTTIRKGAKPYDASRWTTPFVSYVSNRMCQLRSWYDRIGYFLFVTAYEHVRTRRTSQDNSTAFQWHSTRVFERRGESCAFQVETGLHYPLLNAACFKFIAPLTTLRFIGYPSVILSNPIDLRNHVVRTPSSRRLPSCPALTCIAIQNMSLFHVCISNHIPPSKKIVQFRLCRNPRHNGRVLQEHIRILRRRDKLDELAQTLICRTTSEKDHHAYLYITHKPGRSPIS